MFEPAQYELIDFGNGRKLERFGAHVLDRPCPAAEGVTPVNPNAWTDAAASYHNARSPKSSKGNDGRWEANQPEFESSANDADSNGKLEWPVSHRKIRFLLRPTRFGHVGMFPEQASNWDWIARQVKRCQKSRPDHRPRVLNLFAYSGGSTLAAAGAGAEVVHVDAAKTTVAWARANAAASQLSEAPIRWIVEDAMKFTEREIKRGNQYEGIILDPPSYGHGPKGQPWKISQDLIPLLTNCAKLTEQSRQFILFTCHAPDFGPAEAEASLAQAVFGSCSAGATARRLNLQTRSGRKLNAGIVARWPS